MLKKYPIYSSLISSFLLVVYVSAVALLLENGDKLFGKVSNIPAVTLMLLLLVFSVLVCGLLLLGGPIYLYFEKNKKEACKMLLANILFLAIALITALSLQIIL